MIYLVCFAISLFFCFFTKKAANRSTMVFFAILCIAPTVFLAGFRDYSIGTDVKNYLTLDSYWAGAVSSESVFAYLRYYLSTGKSEVLFALYTGIIEKLTGSYRLFLFLSHLIILACVFIGAYRQRKNADPVFVLAIFYLLFFNASLNTIRQYVAMAICFAIFADIEQRKYLRYVIVVVLASFIHISALVSLIALIMFWILYGNKRMESASFGRKFLICVGLVLLLVFFVPLIRALIEYGILGQKYSFYLEQQEGGLSLLYLYLLMLEFVVIFFYRKTIRETYQYSDFLVLCTFANLTLILLSSFIAYGRRVGEFFSLINILTISLIPRAEKNKKTRLLLNSAIVIVCIAYWYIIYVRRNASQTFPYHFAPEVFGVEVF